MKTSKRLDLLEAHLGCQTKRLHKRIADVERILLDTTDRMTREQRKVAREEAQKVLAEATPMTELTYEPARSCNVVDIRDYFLVKRLTEWLVECANIARGQQKEFVIDITSTDAYYYGQRSAFNAVKDFIEEK